MELTLMPVTAENRAQALRLEVFPHQTGFIETTAQCLEEADALSQWRPVLILSENTPVGFSMYGYFEKEGRLWFDRLLIDRHYQGRGFGQAAIRQVLTRMRREYPPQDIYLSVYAPNARAIALYKAYGFRFNGELDTGGEQVMVLSPDTPIL